MVKFSIKFIIIIIIIIIIFKLLSLQSKCNQDDKS